jgi:hypothetical protein
MTKREGSAASMSCIPLCHNKRTVFEMPFPAETVQSSPMTKLSRAASITSLVTSLGHQPCLVDFQNTLNLHQETMKQTKIATSNPEESFVSQ